MPSVFDLLEQIEKRPSMFVGGAPDEYAGRLDEIETLLAGYAMAVRLHGLKEPLEDFQRAFSDYLQKRFKWGLEVGFASAIRKASKDDKDAWRRFWVLTKDFRKTVTSK